MSAPAYITTKLQKLQTQIGRTAIAAQYPSDFEVYLVALELTDSLGVTEDYFVFPVMPSQIQKIENNRTTVKKSSAGTTILYSNSFTPNDIMIKGNFGRGFKLLVKYDNESNSFGVGINFNKLSVKTPQFDATVKNGFGATKILQRIVNTSSQLDWLGNPRRLFFHNMALGESYLCIVPNGGLNLNQSYDSNMIWNYSLNLTAVANLEDLKASVKQSSSQDLMKSSIIQNGVNTVVGSIKSVI